MNNLNSRRLCVEKLIGRQVEVRRLMERRPQDVPNVDVYVPLPEYGIALWTYLETHNDQGKGS